MRGFKRLLAKLGLMLLCLVVIVWAYNNPHQAGTLVGEAVQKVFGVIAAIWDKVVGQGHGVKVTAH